MRNYCNKDFLLKVSYNNNGKLEIFVWFQATDILKV